MCLASVYKNPALRTVDDSELLNLLARVQEVALLGDFKFPGID